MAELDKYDREGTRRDWIRWAIEFMRRGLWPDDVITVHGPHGPEGMWGEAEATEDGSSFLLQCKFVTGEARNIYDIRRVRISSKDGSDSVQFPLLKESELSPKAQRWLKAASRTQANFEREEQQLSQLKRDCLTPGGADLFVRYKHAPLRTAAVRLHRRGSSRVVLQVSMRLS